MVSNAEYEGWSHGSQDARHYKHPDIGSPIQAPQNPHHQAVMCITSMERVNPSLHSYFRTAKLFVKPAEQPHLLNEAKHQ